MSPDKREYDLDPMAELEMMDELQIRANENVRETLPVEPAEEMDDEMEAPKDPDMPNPTADLFDVERLVNDIDEHWEDEMLDL